MTYDEDAAKVLASVHNYGGFAHDTKLIVAFGRRCAEQMREKCANKVRALMRENTSSEDFYAGYDQALFDAEQAIRRVEVK